MNPKSKNSLGGSKIKAPKKSVARFYFLILFVFIVACSSKNEPKTYQFGSYLISFPNNWTIEKQNTIDGGSTKFVLPSCHQVYLTYGSLSRRFKDRYLDDNDLFIDSLKRGEFVIYSRMSRNVGYWLEFFVEHTGGIEDVIHISGIGLDYEEEGLLFSALRTLRFSRGNEW